MKIPRAAIFISLFLVTFGAFRIMTADEPTPKPAKPATSATERGVGQAETPQKLQSTTAPAPGVSEAQKRAEAFIAGLDYGFRLGQRTPDLTVEMARSLGLPLWRQAEAQQLAAQKQP